MDHATSRRSTVQPPRPHATGPTAAPSAIVLIAGLWLLVGWWVLGYGYANRAVAVDVIIGAVLAALASFRLLAPLASRGIPVLMTWAGVLLVIAPVVLRYGFVERVTAAYVNDILVGLVVVGAGLWASRQTPGL